MIQLHNGGRVLRGYNLPQSTIVQWYATISLDILVGMWYNVVIERGTENMLPENRTQADAREQAWLYYACVMSPKIDWHSILVENFWFWFNASQD